MMQKRYDYLDFAKGFGILAVVWAHIMLVGWTHRLIYAFHMPLFFFISGMLFKKENYSSFSSFIKKKYRRLVVPYLIYSVITWFVWALFRYLRGDEVDSYWMPLLQTVLAQGSGAFIVHNSALWFIPCLFVVETIYYFISSLDELSSFIICLLCSVISFVLGDFFGSDYWLLPPWNLDAALIALPFFCIGYIITRHYSHQQLVTTVKEHCSISFVALIILTIVLLFLSERFAECSMGSSSYNCSGWVFMLRALIGCLSLLLFSIFVELLYKKGNLLISKLLEYVKWSGINSLDIMCLHIPIKGFCVIVISVLLKTTTDEVGIAFYYSFLAFLITMMIVSSLILLINKYIRN